MAHLFKKQITRYLDESNRRVEKSAPGARKVVERSRKWYGRLRDSSGKLREVPLCKDKLAAQSMLTDLLRTIERGEAGLENPLKVHATRELTGHLDDYRRHLLAKGSSTVHVNQTIQRIQKLFQGCRFQLLKDLDNLKVENWLTEQRTSNPRFSIQTRNFYLDGVKSFCRWLVHQERLLKNPVANLKRLNVEIDRRHDRRALSEEDFARLIAVTEQGRTIEGLSGPDRAMLYLLATWTGFRRAEIASLTLQSFDLTSSPPVVHVAAGYSKHRRADCQPLHEVLVERLQRWLSEKNIVDTNQPLFVLRSAKGYVRKTSKMMKHDLEAAGIPYRDEKGLYADFHANRHMFISRLSRAGVSLVVAQKLARHSDPRLTANRYTHLELQDKAAALASVIPRQELLNPKLATRAIPPLPNAAPETEPTAEQERLVALPVALPNNISRRDVTASDTTANVDGIGAVDVTSLPAKEKDALCHHTASSGRLHPGGFEPPTFGSVGRRRQEATNR